MKKIFSFAKRKRGLSQSTSDTASVVSAGYELKDKDLGKLHKAASAGDVAKLRQLIKKHDINQLDKENRTPLHLACAGGHAESVAFLVENKSKLNICDNDNRSPLMKAVQCQQERCALILLDHDADPNLVDINDNTAMHLAALIPNISVAIHLLEHEARIDIRNKEGFTPLLLAVNENHQEMVEFLLKEGANINAKDLAGRTSLMLAASTGQISMVKLLLQYDADITMKEDKGWTADDYAVMNGHHACSHLIIEHGTKKKLHQSPPYYGTSKVKGVSMFSSPDRAAEAAFALGGPATDREAFQQSPEQKSRASESEKVEYDASQGESVSRASNVASDSWPSSDEEEELDFSPKKLQKPSLAKLVNASQQSKKKINEKANSSKVQQMAISHPLKSNVDSEEDSEEDSEDEEEIIENYGLQTHPSPHAKALVVSPQAAVPSPSSFVEPPQSISTPSKGFKQDRVQDGSSDEEEEVEEQHVGKFRDTTKEPVIQNTISNIIQQEKEASHQKVQRDLMSELGLEEIDGEEDIESPWDSESITESLKKKSSASSSAKDQIKMNSILENQDDGSVSSAASHVTLQTPYESPEGIAAAQMPSPKIAVDKHKSEFGKGDAGVIEETDWDSEETNLPLGKITPEVHSVAKTTIQASGPQETEPKMPLSEEEDDDEEKCDWERKKDKHIFETTRVNDTVSNECPPSANKTGVADILLSQQKENEIDLNEDPDFDSSEKSAEVVETNEKSGMLLEERYEKVWVEKEKREIASHLKSLTAELRQSFEEIRQNKVSAVGDAEDNSGGDSSSESDEILFHKKNEDTALEQPSEEYDVCDNEGRILQPIPEQQESITEDFSSKATDVGNKPQISLEPQKLPELKTKEDSDDMPPFPPAGNAVSKELQWETVKEDLVKETEIYFPKEGGTDIAGYVTDLDSDGGNDGSLQVHSGSNKNICSDDENPSPLENTHLLNKIKLVGFTPTKGEGCELQDNIMARGLLPQNVKTPEHEDFPHPDAKTPETLIDDLEYSPRKPPVIASKPYSDEELEEDVQRFKNEVGMLKVVFLALEKKKAQLQKEVEEEKRKNLQNRERNQLDEMKLTELAGKYEGSQHLQVKQVAEKIIHEKVNQRTEPKLLKEQVGKDGDRPKQQNTSLIFRINEERQRESFLKERIKKQNIFKGIELGSDEDDYENRQHNQWPKQIGQELKRKDRRLALQQTSCVNGDSLSAFYDSTPSEMSQDEAGVLKTATKKASRVVTVSDDLDDLTQSSDSTADSSESPASVYRNAPLLIAQLGAEKLDSVSLLKIQNLMYEYERSVEREKSRYSLLSEKVKQLENERKEHYQTLEETREMKSKLEHQKVEWETDLNSLRFRIKQEEEKRKNAEMLYEKSREQVQKKEAQYCKEIEAKQELEQTVRNLEMERRTLISNLKQLDEEQNDLQRVLSQERSARVVHEGIFNNHLRKQREIDEENKKSVSKNTEALIHFSETNEREKDLMQQNCSLQDEVSVLKLELDRVRARNQEEQGKYMEENEALKERLEYLKKDLKDNEEALTQTALQCNGQLNALKTETAMLASQLEREKQNREKLETDMEIMHSRLNSALQEIELSQTAKGDGEKTFQRERDEWLRLDEKRNHEISNLRETTNSLSQQLSKAEAKANNLDNESHRATLSLTEKNLILESVQRDLNQSLARTKELEHALHLEKEQMSKYTVRQESMQERLAQTQSDNMLLRQQLEDAHNKGIKKEQAVSDVQERFSDIFSKLRGDSERQINLIEERNKELIIRNNEQKEHIYKFENEKTERESILRQHQQELADALKKLSMSEASLEVTTRYRNELEEEKTRMQKQLDKLKSKLQNTEEKHVHSERRIQELQNALDEKEHQVIASSQKMQELLTVSSQSKEGAKQLEEHVQRLEIENAKLEALVKQKTSRSEMLQKELQETASSPGYTTERIVGHYEDTTVRGRLEDLVTSLQGVKVNLEEQLNQEVQKQVVLSQTAKDSHHLWEEELKSRSKLGLRLSKLDREKDELASQIESEKKKVKKIAEGKRSVETRLDQEMKRNAELQKELSRMRTLLKGTKKKLKEYENGGFVSQLSSIRGELDHRHSETEVTINKLKSKVDELSQQLEVEYVKCRRLESASQEQLEQVASMRSLQRNHDRLEKSKQHLEDEVARLKRQVETNVMDHSHMEQYKREIEEHARKEIKQKLEEVNLFLQTQQASQEALEQLRATNEGTVRNQLEQRIRDLESELTRVRSSQQDSLNLRESAQSEVERYKELYTEELKSRKSLAAKLDRANERLSEANTKLLNERQRSKSLIASSIMNGSLTATPALDMGQLQSAMANIGNNMGTFNRNFSIGGNFPSPVVDGMSSTNRVESYLTKMQNALEKNISKELHEATADLDGIPTRVSPQGSAASSLKSINQDQDPVTRATQQYLEVLKKNYML
uniref:Uncharacterized protein n=1 Tax=Callorhinchus milii TaxID=7868 RepID=A0A4W3IVU5_CALMI